MEVLVDFLNVLDDDMSMKILLCLDDPADIVRVSFVSRSWRHFVIANCISRQLCLRMFPCLSRVDSIVESPSSRVKVLPEVGCSGVSDWEILKREHRAYAFLAHSCISFPLGQGIAYAISASSTDNYPQESISNTLEPRDRIARQPSYWSSRGQSNPNVPEKLVYKLVSDVCVITEISIQPFQAYFQYGAPIYSANSVRFRMGHPKVPMGDLVVEPLDSTDDDKFIWTYTSQEFPVARENRLQKFVLPEPVLCIGGILQIDLLGRVQTQEMDGLFYICVSHVEVVGRPCSRTFAVESLEPTGNLVLKVLSYDQPSLTEDPESLDSSGYFQRARELGRLVNLLRGVENNWDDEEEDDDDDDSDEEALIF